jgi:hypothetical protein
LDVVADFTVINPDDLKSITRGTGVTVRWSGGDSAVPVQISGTSVAIHPDGTSGAEVSFFCLANNSDGRFVVPSSILMQLPATSGFAGAGLNVPVRGTFSVAASGKGTRITATGVDYFVANNSWTWTVTSEYR